MSNSEITETWDQNLPGRQALDGNLPGPRTFGRIREAHGIIPSVHCHNKMSESIGTVIKNAGPGKVLSQFIVRVTDAVAAQARFLSGIHQVKSDRHQQMQNAK
jgi:hypothetical protein